MSDSEHDLRRDWFQSVMAINEAAGGDPVDDDQLRSLDLAYQAGETPKEAAWFLVETNLWHL